MCLVQHLGPLEKFFRTLVFLRVLVSFSSTIEGFKCFEGCPKYFRTNVNFLCPLVKSFSIINFICDNIYQVSMLPQNPDFSHQVAYTCHWYIPWPGCFYVQYWPWDSWVHCDITVLLLVHQCFHCDCYLPSIPWSWLLHWWGGFCCCPISFSPTEHNIRLCISSFMYMRRY